MVMSDFSIGKQSVIVRCHDINCIKEMDYCFFSLLGQSYRPLEVVVVCQSFREPELQKVEQLVRNYYGYTGVEWVVRNIELDRPGDYRSRLLNEGIAAATGQYLSFLDYDDAIYPETYSLLIRTLCDESVAIAFGRIVISVTEPGASYRQYTDRHDEWFVGRQTKQQLFAQNFCPIHSFVIDRTQIDPGDLFFAEEATRFEDYHFLLRIVARYPASFTQMSKIIGQYVIKLDGSNTVCVHPSGNAGQQSEWTKMEKWLESEKRKITVTLSLHELNQMLEFERNKNLAAEELSQLLQSKSWKLTAPLRWAKRQGEFWRRKALWWLRW